ncbi:MAG: cytochrome c [Acidobacteriia bacterium]|nr:cytochrome c [Methyloceanibacter sp.]MCL6492342.1 cytochrome c [Terriglobia bacterium]
MKLLHKTLSLAVLGILTTLVLTWAKADEKGVPVPSSELQLPAGPPFASPEDAIQQRRAAYKLSGGVFKAMKEAVEAGKDVRPFADDARFLVSWSRKIPEMFPPGSDTGKETKALPKIWQDKKTFDERAAAYTAEAEKLAALAEAGDKAGFAQQFQATGKACGACHKVFRARVD